MRKFPKLRYPSHDETDGLLDGEVVVTEKLDGANFRFEIDDGITIGTRNHEYDIDDENVPKAFYHARDWLQNLSQQQASTLSGAGTFFGEAMHRHSIVYEDVEYEVPESGSPYFGNAPNVVLFDWYRDGEWVDWNSFEHITDVLDLPTAKVLERGDPDDLSFDIPEESMFGGAPEGIVVRRVDGTVRAKKVSNDFKEQNAVTFEEPSKAESDAAKFVAAYITKARIEKMAHKLVDRGHYEQLEMPMMADLPRRVIEDAMAENGWDLLTSGGFEAEWDDDFKGDVRSRTSKKCARVLKESLQSI